VNEVLAAVTPALSERIGPDGRFGLSTSGREDEITALRAQELTTVWAKRFAPLEMKWLEETRGAAVNFKSLVVCGRALYARGAFERLPVTVPAPKRKPYGSWWLVTLCAGSEPQVSLAVSAEATELRIENGHIVFPFISGNEFFAIGIPPGHTGEFPMSPERAVVQLSGNHHALASTVPELRMPLPLKGGPPQASRWRITLDHSVNVVSGNHRLPTEDLFAGRGSSETILEFIPAEDQPATIEFLYPPQLRPGESEASYQSRLQAETGRAVARRIPDMPVRFDALSNGGAGQ